jgi:hypothetical protein
MAVFSLRERANYVKHAGCASKRPESASLLALSRTIVGVSNIGQIPDGQKRQVKNNRYAIPKRSVFDSSCTGTHPGVLAETGRAKGNTMQLPSILQGESLKRLLQGAAVGAVATIFVGFSWGGWSLGSTADKMAKEQSERSVVAALAPVCADKFRALPDAEAKTIALSKVEAWKRGEEFPKEIVTLPGETSPNYALVYACSTLLLAPKSAALQ